MYDPTMHRGDRREPPTEEALPASGNILFIANEAAQETTTFPAGDQATQTTWTGRVRLSSAIPSGQTITIQLGVCDDALGTNFSASGPTVTLTGDGSTTLFTFASPAKEFSVATSKFLAARFVNGDSTNAYSILVGGGESYISSSKGSGDYPLPVSVASFVAKGLNGAVRLEWTTGQETHNLGFNLYRQALPGGCRIRVNEQLIPSRVEGDGGAEYVFLDTKGIENGRAYAYYLEDAPTDQNLLADTFGPTKTIPGPISLWTPVDGAPV